MPTQGSILKRIREEIQLDCVCAIPTVQNLRMHVLKAGRSTFLSKNIEADKDDMHSNFINSVGMRQSSITALGTDAKTVQQVS